MMISSLSTGEPQIRVDNEIYEHLCSPNYLKNNINSYLCCVMFTGVASVSARSLYKILTADNTKYHPSNRDGYTSNAAIIMIGGAQEALNCRPNNYAIILKKRKGFVKMAIRTG